MPQAVVGIGAALAGGSIAASIGGTTGLIVGSLVSTAISFAGAKAFGPDTPKASFVDDLERGTFINAVGTEEYIPVIYGQAKVGGIRFFGPELTGGNDEFLHMTVAWSEGEISAVDTLLIDDLVSTDAVFSGLTLINHHVGTDDQVADADLQGVAGWSEDHRARGVAYTAAKITGDDSAFHAGMPELSAIINGKLVLDVRDSMTKFSDNPALVIYDYATNTRYGRGIPASKIDTQSFIDAANFCDELVTVPDDSGGNTTQKRYTCAGVVDTGRDLVENMRDLMTSCRGQVLYTAGKWHLFIDKAESSVFSITEDHIIGEWSFRLSAQTDVLNRVKMNFLDPDREWQPNFAVWEDATLRADEDDGLLLERNISLPFTKNLHMAEQLALIEGKYSRFGIEVSMLCTIEAAQLLPMDVVTVTHTTPGWTSKKFRVVNLVIEQNGNVRLFLREYSDSIYTLDPLEDADLAPTTNLPDTRIVAGPSAFSHTTERPKTFEGDESYRLKLFWTLPNDQFVLNGGQTEVQFKESTDTVWRPSWFVAGGQEETYVAQVELNKKYDARIRHVNVFGAKSTFATILGLQLTVPSEVLSIDDGFFSGQDAALDFGTFAAALDGENADEVYQVDATGPTFVDITTDFNDVGDADFEPFPSSEETGDYIAIGSELPFTKAVFDNLNGTAGIDGVVAWEYWDGGAWAALSNVSDGTSGFTAAASDGQEVTFDMPTDWAQQSLDGGAQLYYIRARVTTVYTTNPVYDQGRVNRDYGLLQSTAVETLEFGAFGG